ncbi:hypothetical protein KI387_004775, partial [Taxus chinensis]
LSVFSSAPLDSREIEKTAVQALGIMSCMYLRACRTFCCSRVSSSSEVRSIPFDDGRNPRSCSIFGARQEPNFRSQLSQ